MTDYRDPPPDHDDAIADDMTRPGPPPPPSTAAPNRDDRAGSSRPLGATTINWYTLTDTDAGPAWAALRAWVEWFTVRYRISESMVPVCWFKHGQLVEELSALHTAHAASFDSTDTGYGPMGWHERLSLALPRLSRAYSGGCARGHDPLTPRSWTNVVDEQEWDAWTTQAHAH